jgi:DNA-directed RNA polymerase specialized sigma24 family protein
VWADLISLSLGKSIMCDEPVTNWLRQLEGRDEQAALQLWQQYYREVVELARARLAATSRRVVDEEDVAQSVMRCLYEGAAMGQYTEVVNRQQLWQLLATITIRKVIDKQRLLNQQKRGSGMVRGDSALRRHADDDCGSGFDRLSGDHPTPEVLAIAVEEYQRLMGRLDDDCLREIAQYRLDGYKNEEIGERLGLTSRSIERKLQRIRQIWAEESPQ